ncbi:MAG: HD domain-containing protein [Candidatus Shapirobacteria bacterium]|jgi:(p)ppGpp synthase/HD superfamily hydrolase
MQLTPKIQKAIKIAAEKHAGQVRQGDNLPFIVHLLEVAWVLSNYSNDENVIVAGLVHNVVNNVDDYSFVDIKNDFGELVMAMVFDVSEDKEAGSELKGQASWEERKNKYLQHAETMSQEAMLICAADKIVTLTVISNSMKTTGKELWNKMGVASNKLFWFYGEILKILQKRSYSKISEEMAAVLKRVQGETSILMNS